MQSLYLQEHVFEHEFKDGVCVVIRLIIFAKCAVYISSVSVFQCEYVCFDIRLTILGNFFVYIYIYVTHYFLVQIQL